MNAASPHRSRLAIVILIALTASSVWISRQLKLSAAQRQLVESRAQLAALDDQFVTLTNALETSRRELKAEHLRRDQAVADLSDAQRALEEKHPESRWTLPPASLPEWSADSPYVWLRKEMLPRFPVDGFSEDGELRPEIAYVMTVDPASGRALNEQLKKLLAEYRALEAAKAERSDEHLPGIGNEPGEKLTIRVNPLPEDGARIKLQFETALTDALGEQRATMLKQLSESWLATQFAQSGSEPKTISVVRRSAGNFNISVKTGGSWISMGGPASVVMHQIPPHLRPMFAAFLESGSPVVVKSSP